MGFSMGKFEKYVIFAHFGPFPIILKQNQIFQTILLVIMALCNERFSLIITFSILLVMKKDVHVLNLTCSNVPKARVSMKKNVVTPDLTALTQVTKLVAHLSNVQPPLMRPMPIS